MPNADLKKRLPLPDGRTSIVVLLLVGLVMLLLKTALVSREQALDELENKLAADLNRYALSLQQKLDQYQELPRLMATEPALSELLANQTDDYRAGAQEYLAQVTTSVGVENAFLLDSQGVALASGGEADSLTGQNFSFWPYYHAALTGQQGRYFALGTINKTRSYFFSHPIFVANRVAGVVVVQMDLAEIERQWWDAALHDLEVVVTDEDGVIALSTRSEWLYRTLLPLSTKTRERIVQSQRYGGQAPQALDIIERQARNDGSELLTLLDNAPGQLSNTELEGLRTGQFMLLSRTLPGSGLRIAVISSLRPVGQQIVNALLLVGLGGTALIALISLLFARQRIQQERDEFYSREQQTLAASEARVQAIIDHTRAGLVMLDEQGRVETFNRNAEQLFGYTHDKIAGQFFSELLVEQDRPLFWRHVTSDASELARELKMEAHGRKHNGESFPMELVVGQIPLEEGSHFLVTMQDISERKAYEQALQCAMREKQAASEARIVALEAELSALRREAAKG